MTQHKQNTLTEYQITQEQAIEYIDAWKRTGHLYHASAFTFHYHEFVLLQTLVQMYNTEPERGERPEVNAFRFYRGLKKDTDGNYTVPCMMIVGVSGFCLEPDGAFNGGDDIISMTKDGIVATIYDFSYPCPDTCANEGHTILDAPNVSASAVDRPK